jgi:hypothetical protein
MFASTIESMGAERHPKCAFCRCASVEVIACLPRAQQGIGRYVVFGTSSLQAITYKFQDGIGVVGVLVGRHNNLCGGVELDLGASLKLKHFLKTSCHSCHKTPSKKSGSHWEVSVVHRSQP